MNRRMQWTAGLVLMVLSATASAQNYEYLGYKMLNPPAYPFKYYIDARPNNTGIAITEVERVTQAAFKAWDDVSCAYPSFQYLGRTTTDVTNPLDAINVSTIWVTSSGDPNYASVLGSGRSYSGSVPLTYAGYLYQCDIYINAVDFTWSTLDTPRQPFMDLQSLLTHEIGHCLGLGDAYQPDTAVMFSDFATGTARRVLDTQDVKEICDYYPQDGAMGSPCSLSDKCPSPFTCVPFKNTSGTTLYEYCTKGCTGVTNGECDSPFACRDSTLVSGSTKACLAVPGEAVTQVGKPCNEASDPAAECGSPRSMCQGPTSQPSQIDAWVGGYCYEECLVGGSNTCPGGSACVEFGATDRCLKRCRPGTADCRDGYTCAPTAQGDVCVPNCYSNQDCPNTSTTTFICRTCDHVCIENKSSGRSVGDPCSNPNGSECGPGQFCLFLNGNPQGVCAQTCSTAQCGCPLDSSCKNVGPDKVCMKNCDVGTCASPLQCNPVGSSLSCTPACRKTADCPTGFSCYGGRCELPQDVPDAGCTLCSDGGNPPPPPPPTDGGTGGNTDGPSGCGCGEAPGSALVLFGVLALVLFSGRRRSWQHR